MWQNIAQYVITIDPNHQYIMFELFNEPVNDGCIDSIEETTWYNEYIIPAIRGIREIESTMKSYNHIIIARFKKSHFAENLEVRIHQHMFIVRNVFVKIVWITHASHDDTVAYYEDNDDEDEF
jgi:hypothetical protein